jgi:hypothetical protein
MASTSAFVTAEPLINSYANAESLVQGGVPIGVSAEARGSCSQGACTGASATAEFNDTVTLTDPRLPKDTPLTVIANVNLDPLLNAIGPGSASGVQGLMSIVTDQPGVLGGSSMNCVENYYASNSPSGPPRIDITPCPPTPFVFFNGEPAAFQVVLDVTAYPGPGGDYALASDPFHFSLIPSNSGETFQSAAGVNYLSPDASSVPEPTSLLLLGTGLVCLGSWGRKILKGL